MQILISLLDFLIYFLKWFDVAILNLRSVNAQLITMQRTSL